MRAGKMLKIANEQEESAAVAVLVDSNSRRTREFHPNRPDAFEVHAVSSAVNRHKISLRVHGRRK